MQLKKTRDKIKFLHWQSGGFILYYKRLESGRFELPVYDDQVGSHDYILAPNRKVKAKTMMDCLSKGFSHYYGFLGTERDLQFKNLRKTYLTYLVSVLGGEAKSLSSHASDEVLQKHYIDQKIVNKAVKNLDIFKN